MGTVRQALQLSLLALAAGCNCSDNPPPPRCLVTNRGVDALLIAGERSTVSFGLNIDCGSPELNASAPKADQVTVEVLDPANKAVLHLSLTPRQVDSALVLADLTFTPGQPGPWHLSATFEPSIGRVQLDVEVAEMHHDAGFRVVAWNGPADCEQYDLTEAGTVLCLQAVADPDSEKIVTASQTLSASGYALDHNALWRWIAGDAGVVVRMIDDGGMFQTTHTFNVGSAVWGGLAAEGGSGWLLELENKQGPFSLFHLRPSPDGGTPSDRTEVTGGRTFGIVKSQVGVAAHADGRVIQTDSSLILERPDGGSEEPAADGTSLLGADSQGLWILHQSNLVLIAPGAAGLDRATLALPGSLAMIRRHNPVVGAFPPVLARGMTPRPDGTRLALEAWDVGSLFEPVSSATRSHAFARSIDGKSLKIFDR